MGRPQGCSTPDFESLVAYLASGKYPHYMRNDRGKKVNFRRQAASYSLRSGVLFRKHRPHRHGGVVLELRVVTERKEREWILRACHEGTSGTAEDVGLQGVHVGQGKTCARILERFWWPGVTRDVVHFIRACAHCHKTGHSAPEELSDTSAPVPDHPWNRLVVDLVSLPRTAEGYVGVALVVDCHSKWVEGEPLHALSVECVARFLSTLICRYGCAYDIQIKNQGQEFVKAVSKNLLDLVGLKQKITSIFDFSGNCPLEVKACGCIQDFLARVLKSKQQDWPTALPRILFAHRVSKLEQSEHSPFFLMYGRHPHTGPEPGFSGSCEGRPAPTALALAECCPENPVGKGSSIVSGATDSPERSLEEVGEIKELYESTKSSNSGGLPEDFCESEMDTVDTCRGRGLESGGRQVTCPGACSGSGFTAAVAVSAASGAGSSTSDVSRAVKVETVVTTISGLDGQLPSRAERIVNA